MVVKQVLQKEIEEKAFGEAKSLGLSGYAASDLVCEAADIVVDFFAYMTWTTVADGTIHSKDCITEVIISKDGKPFPNTTHARRRARLALCKLLERPRWKIICQFCLGC